MKILIILLMPCACMAQNKIGNITVSEIEFKNYLTNCYQKPDTISRRTEYDYGACMNCTFYAPDRDMQKRLAEDYNEQLERISIGIIMDTSRYPPYNDTIFSDGSSSIINSFNKAKPKKGSVVKNITTYPASEYIRDTGKRLVPRKPTEEDFIKWKINQP